MTNPPIKKLDQTDYIKTNVRLPRDLHAELSAEAHKNGRSLNSEIISGLRKDQGTVILAEITELKAMVQTLLDKS